MYLANMRVVVLACVTVDVVDISLYLAALRTQIRTCKRKQVRKHTIKWMFQFHLLYKYMIAI